MTTPWANVNSKHTIHSDAKATTTDALCSLPSKMNITSLLWNKLAPKVEHIPHHHAEFTKFVNSTGEHTTNLDAHPQHDQVTNIRRDERRETICGCAQTALHFDLDQHPNVHKSRARLIFLSKRGLCVFIFNSVSALHTDSRDGFEFSPNRRRWQ